MVDNDTLIGGRYLLQEPLGIGSMGEVYCAQDRFANTTVALKRVTSNPEAGVGDGTSDSGTLPRLALVREFQALASMRHPNIISVLDYGFDERKQPYITMELLDKPQSILEAAQGQPLGLKVDLVIQVLRALTYMHRHGIIHRDLKPSNIQVIAHPGDPTRRQVKVLDFGVATSRTEIQDGDYLSGTLAYLAPEILTGSPATEASDLYAVGVILYELLRGEHPFGMRNGGWLVQQILYAEPDIAALNVPFPLAQVVGRLLSKTPEGRYRDANAVIDGLCIAIDQPLPLETTAIRESFLQAAPFVGREAEFSRLTSALNEALAGRGSTWLIGGESGVGKSRLMMELRTLALVKGARVLRGQAQSEGNAAYTVWRDSVRSLAAVTDLPDADLSVLKQIVPDLEMLIGRALPDAPPLAASESQARLFMSVYAVLVQQPQPLVLLLDDFHWAGDEDLALLRWLSGSVPDLPLLIIADYRNDERPDLPTQLPGTQTLTLTRLSESAIRELSGAMLGAAGHAPDVIDLLQRETEGNVFFLIEVVRALAEEAGQLDNVAAMPLPERVFAGGVQQVIHRRLDKVPEAARSPLRLAAVIGRTVDPVLMRAARPTLNLTEWLMTCASVAVLAVQDGQWEFAHDKLRDGVLAELDDGQRQTLHRDAAEAIEAVYPGSTNYAAALAFHWAVAGDDAKEAHYAGMAGAQALAVSAFADAARYLSRAVELTTDEGPQLVAYRQQLADTYMGMSAFDDAIRLYELNLAECTNCADQRGIAAALAGLGMVAEARSDFTDAARYFTESLAIARKVRDRHGMARSLERLGIGAYRVGDYSGARAYAEEALAVNATIDNPASTAENLRGLGMVSAALGDYASARHYFQGSLALYRQIGQRRGIGNCLNNLGIIAVTLGDLEQGKALYLDSLAIKAETGDRQGRANVLNNLGIVTLQLGQYEETRRVLEECLAISEQLGDRQGVADAMINLGRALVTLGDDGEALRMFRDSQAIYNEIGDRWGLAIALLNQGRVMRERDKADEAANLFHQSLDIAWDIQKTSTVVQLLVEIALLWSKLGRDLNAVELLGVTLDHPALNALYQTYADALYADLSAQFDPDTLASALERYAVLDAAVTDLLAGIPGEHGN